MAMTLNGVTISANGVAGPMGQIQPMRHYLLPECIQTCFGKTMPGGCHFVDQNAPTRQHDITCMGHERFYRSKWWPPHVVFPEQIWTHWLCGCGCADAILPFVPSGCTHIQLRDLNPEVPYLWATALSIEHPLCLSW